MQIWGVTCIMTGDSINWCIGYTAGDWSEGVFLFHSGSLHWAFIDGGRYTGGSGTAQHNFLFSSFCSDKACLKRTKLMYSPKAFDLSLNVQIFCISLSHFRSAYTRDGWSINPDYWSKPLLVGHPNLSPWQVARWAWDLVTGCLESACIKKVYRYIIIWCDPASLLHVIVIVGM